MRDMTHPSITCHMKISWDESCHAWEYVLPSDMTHPIFPCVTWLIPISYITWRSMSHEDLDRAAAIWIHRSICVCVCVYVSHDLFVCATWQLPCVHVCVCVCMSASCETIRCVTGFLLMYMCVCVYVSHDALPFCSTATCVRVCVCVYVYVPWLVPVCDMAHPSKYDKWIKKKQCTSKETCVN